MRLLRTLLAAGLLLTVGFVWAGGQGDAAGAAAGEQEITEITWWFGEWNEPRGTNLARKFEEENPGYRINVEPFAGEGMRNKMLVAFRSGSVPHVLAVPNGWTIPFAQQGYLSTVNDYVESRDFPMDDYIQSGLDTARYNGDYWGIPYRIESHAFIYNKDLYREVGLDPESPPETWAELLDYARQLTNPDEKRYGYGITGGGERQNTIFLLLPMIWMNGGDIISADGTEAVINQPEAVEAVERYTDYYVEYKVSPPSTPENGGTAIRRLFEQGVNAQMQQGSYALPTIRENSDIDVGTAMIPHPEGRDPAAILGGWNYTVPEGVENREAAYKFITFLTREDNMAEFTDTFPARHSAMEAERFNAPELQPFIEMLPYARQQPTVEQWPEITNVVFTEVQNILLERKEVQEAMDDAASQINDLLAQ